MVCKRESPSRIVKYGPILEWIYEHALHQPTFNYCNRDGVSSKVEDAGSLHCYPELVIYYYA